MAADTFPFYLTRACCLFILSVLRFRGSPQKMGSALKNQHLCSAGSYSHGDGTRLFLWGWNLAGPWHPSQVAQTLPSWLRVGDDTVPVLAGPGSNCSLSPLCVLGWPQPAGVSRVDACGCWRCAWQLGGLQSSGTCGAHGQVLCGWGPPWWCLGAPKQRFQLGFGPQIPSRCRCDLKSLLGTYLGEDSKHTKSMAPG